MKSLLRAGRWCAPIFAVGLALCSAPIAGAAPPDVRPTLGSHASQTPITVGFISGEPVAIRYTTDGSPPTATSPVYSTALTFERTTLLRWVATAADDGDTSSGQETYTIDVNPPSVTIYEPTAGVTYIQYASASAVYYCADAEVSWTSCDGSSPFGGAIDTSTPGQHTFTVVAYDSAGNRTEKSATYTVLPATQTGGGVAGDVPATLNLTLGPAPAFGAFVAGVSSDYTTTTTATVTSTAADATLSVSDPSSFATGHLVNGAFSLPQALQASGGGPFAAVGGSAAPTALKTYGGPVTNNVSTLTFKQSIASTDPLRTGNYTKTLTFTLSTTQP
jgi:hypothetical protein